MMNELLVLQNGSDIRGIAIATEEYQVDLTGDAVRKIASGLIHWLTSNNKKKKGESLKIGVGRDSRLSGEMLANALIESLV